MQTSVLNPMQLNVLSLMAYSNTEQEQEELQRVLLQYYQKKADSLLSAFAAQHHITQQTLDNWASQHDRTPYE